MAFRLTRHGCLRLIALAICMLMLTPLLIPAAYAEEIDTEDLGEADDSVNYDYEDAIEANDNNPFYPLRFAAEPALPEEKAEVYGSIQPGLYLEAYPAYVGHTGKLDWWKFTLYGTENLLIEMKDALTEKDAPYNFLYRLDTLSDPQISLQGNVSYGVETGENFPCVTSFNTVLRVGDYRYTDCTHSKSSVDNQLSWLVELPRSAHFDPAKTEGYRFSIYSEKDRRQKVTYTFGSDIVTDIPLYEPMRRGGALQVRIPDPGQIHITITDPRIPDGYTNSPVEKGVIEPYWHVQLVKNAREWYEIIVDGTHGEAMDNMKFYAGRYLRKDDDSNKFSPRSTELTTDCSYEIDGDQLLLTLQYPQGKSVDFFDIEYIAIDMNNGTVLRINQYPLF